MTSSFASQLLRTISGDGEQIQHLVITAALLD
jgi:hypothetical protein